MFLKNTVYLYFLLLLGFLITACKKAPNYSKTPSISFSNLRVVSDLSDPDNPVDSVYISIHFQDGDGDIGDDARKDKDFLVKAYKKINGVYTYVDLGDYDYSGILPQAFSKVAGPLDGTITQVTPFDYIVPNSLGFEKNDTLRFEIQIKDRANNYSNVVQTTDYIMWKNFN